MSENGQYPKGDNGAAENVEDGTLGELLEGASTGAVTQESNLVVVEIKHARALWPVKNSGTYILRKFSHGSIRMCSSQDFLG